MTERKQAVVAAAMGASWSYIVLDFLMHAVVLAPWWRATEAFWLPPLELAKRIPFAYGAFVIYCASLTVLLICHRTLKTGQAGTVEKRPPQVRGGEYR